MDNLLKISDFSYLSGIKRKNLIYYDEIGLLKPERVLDNGYRFYSYRQLETVSVIAALQEVGMTLCEIKHHLDYRTPAALIELLRVQREQVKEKINKLQDIEAMIDTRLAITHRGLNIDPVALELQVCEQELLFAGDEIFCEDTKEAFNKAIEEFYILCDKEKVTYGYPFGTIISKETLLQGKCHYPSRFFFKCSAKKESPPRFYKPCGLYLIGFEHSSDEGSQALYDRMFSYIKEQKLTIAGNSYEEFLLDEISVKDPRDHLLQVSIQVQQNIHC